MSKYVAKSENAFMATRKMAPMANEHRTGPSCFINFQVCFMVLRRGDKKCGVTVWRFKVHHPHIAVSHNPR